MEFQTHYTQRSQITQNNIKKQPITPLYRRTYILAVQLAQTTRSSWLLHDKRYRTKFRNSQIMLRSLIKPLPGNPCTNHTRAEPREKAILTQQIYKLGSLLTLCQQKLSLKVPLKTEENIETAVKYFNNTIQWAGWKATPEHTDLSVTPDYSILIKQKIVEKGKKKMAQTQNIRKQKNTQLSNQRT
jgi:hypothetical protein